MSIQKTSKPWEKVQKEYRLDDESLKSEEQAAELAEQQMQKDAQAEAEYEIYLEKEKQERLNKDFIYRRFHRAVPVMNIHELDRERRDKIYGLLIEGKCAVSQGIRKGLKAADMTDIPANSNKPHIIFVLKSEKGNLEECLA